MRFTLSASATSSATSSGTLASRAMSAIARDSGCRTLSLDSARAFNPSDTSSRARAMSASRSGSIAVASYDGQSERCTDSPVRARFPNSSSATNGHTGASSRARVVRHSCRTACASPSAAFQKRGRLRRTYQLERSSTNAVERLRRPQRVEVLERLGGLADGAVQSRPHPAVHHVRRRGTQRRRRVPAVEVRVGREEGVRVPERHEEPVRRLVDVLEVDALGGPRRAREREVPAHGVGAPCADHLPRVHHVAAALRHLLAVLVEQERQAHHVAVRRPAEHERVHREQRVEPAARLVDRLADEVGREAPLEDLGVLERVVPLRGGHRAGVEPRVEHRLDPPRPTAALLARDRHVVDERSVQVELGEVLAGAHRTGRRPSGRRCRGRSRHSARPGWESPRTGRVTAPSRRCWRASRRSGRGGCARGASRSPRSRGGARPCARTCGRTTWAWPSR